MTGKTGKYKEPSWQTYDQLVFYAIYFFQRYPNISKIKISYVYVEHADMENDLELSREYLGVYVSVLMKLINNIETDVQFLKNPSKLCDYCNFKIHCSEDEV